MEFLEYLIVNSILINIIIRFKNTKEIILLIPNLLEEVIKIFTRMWNEEWTCFVYMKLYEINNLNN